MATRFELEPGPAYRIDKWSCRFNCGWFRCFHTLPTDRQNEVIDHPIWGTVTSYEAANLDIRTHNCREYQEAVARMRGRRAFAQRIRQAVTQ